MDIADDVVAHALLLNNFCRPLLERFEVERSMVNRDGSGSASGGRDGKASDAVLKAVVMELQRTNGAKIKVTIEAEAEESLAKADIGVVRDNARQVKSKAELTGFE